MTFYDLQIKLIVSLVSTLDLICQMTFYVLIKLIVSLVSDLIRQMTRYEFPSKYIAALASTSI